MYKVGLYHLAFGVLLLQLSSQWTYSFPSFPRPVNSNPDCDNPVAPDPEMIKCDVSLLKDRDRDRDREEYSTEWIAYQQLKNLLKTDTPCQFPDEQVVETSLYVHPTLEGGPLLPHTRVQMFGVAILRTPRRGENPKKVVAYPAFGPTSLSEYIDNQEELDTMLKVLTQLELVYVPYVELVSPEQSCYKISGATLVPSRIFHENLPWSHKHTNGSPHLLPSEINLEVQKERLEKLAAEAKWTEIMRTYEPSTRCETTTGDGQIARHYSALQLQSLDVTVNQILTERDYLKLSAQFWNEVQKRVDQLRTLDKSRMKKIY